MTQHPFHIRQPVRWQGQEAEILDILPTCYRVQVGDEEHEAQADELTPLSPEGPQDEVYLNLRTPTLTTVIATVFNHAGGAGKSSIVKNFGHELTQHGYRVLLIDLDPQANLTTWLGVHDATLEESVLLCATERAPLPEPRQVWGLDLIPSHINLANAEGALIGKIGAMLRLRNLLTSPEARARWDVILIDSPPSLGQLTGLGALAADTLIVPVPTRSKGIEALKGLSVAIDNYRESRPDLRVGAWIPTMFDVRRGDDNMFLTTIRQSLSPVASPIPERAAEWLRADNAGLPVTLSAPKSNPAMDVQQITRDLIEALNLAPAGAQS